MERNFKNNVPPSYDLPLYMRLFPNYYDYYGYESYQKPQKRDSFDDFITLYAFMGFYGFIPGNNFGFNGFGRF